MKVQFAFPLLASALMGCANVSSALPGLTSATGEVWYSKDVTILGMALSSDVFYCSPEVPGKCTKARWQEREVMAPAGASEATGAAPATPPDPTACDKAREYAERAAKMSDDAPRAALQRLAERKAKECQALQRSAPAPAH